VTVDLEFPPDRMREMADEVVQRCVGHIASLDRQPVCGDVDAAERCRSLREPAAVPGYLSGICVHVVRQVLARRRRARWDESNFRVDPACVSILTSIRAPSFRRITIR